MKKPKNQTSGDRTEWFLKIQELIEKHSMPITKGPNKGMTTTDPKWIIELFAYVNASIEKTAKESHDGNLTIASSLGLILMNWYLRIHRAKAFDPRRPETERRAAYEQWLSVVKAIQMMIIDERTDRYLMPGQAWENPFHPEITSTRRKKR